MKTLVIVLAVLIPVICSASPWLICDPQAGVTSYQFTDDAFFATKTAEADGSLRYDLAGIPSGTHNIQVRAANLWGVSDPSPFEFSVSIPTVSALRLTP